MARDLNRLMEDLQRSREVFVTQDGEIEDSDEAQKNAQREEARTGAPRPRTRLKPEIFGSDGCAMGDQEQTIEEYSPVVAIGQSRQSQARRGDDGKAKGILVDCDVLRAMHVEAAKYQVETGGIVVGPSDDVVSDLIPSGKDAQRTHASFELDAAYLQPLLEQAEKRGLRFLGVWHVHPRGVEQLSSTDLKAAQRMLCDPDWGVSRLILPLTVRQKSGFVTKFFVAQGDPLTVRNAEVAIGSHDDRSASTGLLRAPSGGMNLLFPVQTGRERVARDLRELKQAGWESSVRVGPGPSFIVIASRARMEVVFQLPPEYPFARPRMAVRVNGEFGEAEAESRNDCTWDSSCSIVELAEKAWHALELPEPVAPPSRTLRERLVGVVDAII